MLNIKMLYYIILLYNTYILILIKIMFFVIRDIAEYLRKQL